MPATVRNLEMEAIEARLHEWAMRQPLKPQFYTTFWWQIKPEFLPSATQAARISEEAYYKFRNFKDGIFDQPTGSE